MIRPLFVLFALAIATAPAAAATYSAKPIAPTAQRFVARDIAWNCGADACQGSTDQSRPLVLCQALVKQAGKVESFSVDGRAISADDLTRCNSVARDVPAKAVAAQ